MNSRTFLDYLKESTHNTVSIYLLLTSISCFTLGTTPASLNLCDCVCVSVSLCVSLCVSVCENVCVRVCGCTCVQVSYSSMQWKGKFCKNNRTPKIIQSIHWWMEQVFFKSEMILRKKSLK